MRGSRIKFGTDGVRGVMAFDFTVDEVRRIAAALSARLIKLGTAQKGVAVAFDRRLLSERFAVEFASVLAGHGVRAHLAAEYLPTPVLSFAVRQGGHAAGVMVTSSHNPPEYNGIKIKEDYGGPSDTETIRDLEKLLEEEILSGEGVLRLQRVEAEKKDLIVPLSPRPAYIEKLRSFIDFDTVGRAGRAAFDAMNGCGAGWTDSLLEQAGTRVKTLREDYNPGFGGRGPEPVEKNLAGLMATVAGGGFDLGLANDGDADRIGAVDEFGNYFSAQKILAAMALYLWEEKGLRGDIAKTVSATSMLDLLALGFGAEVLETPIGFRHTGRLMNERPILVGGEESGAVGMGAHIPERDGVANALVLAELVGKTGEGLGRYIERVFARTGYFAYRRTDLKLTGEEAARARKTLAGFTPPSELLGLPVARTTTMDGIKIVRDDHSWLMIRASGTEPLLRVYAEARSDREADELIEKGRRIAGFQC